MCYNKEVNFLTGGVYVAAADYEKAFKLGKKDYQARMMRGESPTLPALDDILPPRGSYTEIPLGLVQIPVDQIVGTKTNSRSNAFAGNFMPILGEKTEFAYKWSSLHDSHLEEGIRDPIKAYEYMNKFYVEEGNKRVSILKYYDVTTMAGNVTRILPKRTEEKENKIYYEFLDFYEVSKINYIWFSKEGSFKKLQKLVGKAPQEVWTEDDCVEFKSIYTRFKLELLKNYPEPSYTVGDAFLTFISVQGYKAVCEMSAKELKDSMAKSWEEFRLLGKEEDIDLKMDPVQEKKLSLSKFLSVGQTKLKIAFIYEKTVTSSAWTYGHELGRLHLQQTFPEEVSTMYYDGATEATIDLFIQDAIKNGCNIIFTTTPTFVKASVKAAIANPNVRIVNCSVNTSHRYIRTYYIRLHEAKFLMGAIAGSLAENNIVSYIADYPIYGTIADINAFALGAKMVNPRAEVHLEWNCLKDCDVHENIRKVGPACISGKDMVIPEEGSRYFGIYHMEYGHPRNLAMPLMHWGVFYERLIRTIMDGTWKNDVNSTEKAINYWWGMSAGVIDVVCSRHLPIGTKRLVHLLKDAITSGDYNPFSGVLYSQNGIVQDDPERILKPEEMVNMDWLAENIVGHIPTADELNDSAIPIFSQQGIDMKG